ncbi:MAG: hypothetical protein AAB793_00860 [Patescibacteria group bacterium]
MHIWDYNIKKGWKPKADVEWIWFLERKINYDDWKGLNPYVIAKYRRRIKIDPGKRLMIDAYFKKYRIKYGR